MTPPTPVYALTTPVTWDGGGIVLSLHWTEEGAYLEQCRRGELPKTDMEHFDELYIEPMEILD